MQVQKRDNRLVDFNSSKIKTAIQECCKRIQKDYQEETLKVKEHLTEIVDNVCLHLPKNDIVKVEEIQDTVEQELSKVSPQVAKEYIIYRYQRNVARDSNSALTQIYMNLTSKKSSDMDLKRENANINSDTAMGMMLKFGAEASKEFCLNHLIKPKYARMHRNGDIHIHDLDFYPMTFNCSFIPLGKLLKRGFSTGHGHISEPQTIMCASSLACIILQANQNEMYGGQAYSCWDYDLAPYVAKSYVKILNRLVSTKVEHEVKLNLDGLYEEEGTLFSEASQGTIMKEVLKYTEHVEYIMQEARELLYKEVRQAMQASIHNFNTLQSRAGSQTPFSSVNYGTDTSVEGRMITKATLEETDKGLANGETSIFPVQIFKVQNSKNALEGSPNYDLFKLACKVSAKRLFPNFVYQDSPYNAMYYDGRKETEIAVMGCRTRTIQNVHNPEQNVTSGRGNITFTTINLPRLGLLAKHDLNKFFKLFDDRIECCIGQIYDRFNFISKKKVYNFPFLMQEGVYLDSEKLDNDDEILESLKNGTLAVGFIGLAECLKALIGKHQGESQEAQELGLKIIQHLRDRMDLESKNSKLTWGCFATPAEGLSSRFTKIDQKKFGKIEGVTDRKYYTNSFHVPVYYNTSIVHKIDVEAPYHEICNAGSISYVEMDGDLTKNVEAFEKVVQYAKEKNMCYFSINHPVDVCPVCGYTGVIYDECPKCGFKEGIGTSVKRLEALNCKC